MECILFPNKKLNTKTMAEERQRYSDSDLNEFKELIQAKIIKAERD